jgi:hypothetical protein
VRILWTEAGLTTALAAQSCHGFRLFHFHNSRIIDLTSALRRPINSASFEAKPVTHPGLLFAGTLFGFEQTPFFLTSPKGGARNPRRSSQFPDWRNLWL